MYIYMYMLAPSMNGPTNTTASAARFSACDSSSSSGEKERSSVVENGPAAVSTLNGSDVISRSEGGMALGGRVPGTTLRALIVWPCRLTPTTATV